MGRGWPGTMKLTGGGGTCPAILVERLKGGGGTQATLEGRQFGPV